MTTSKFLLGKYTKGETLIGEGCFVEELCTEQALPGASLARARVEPGVTTELHALRDITETYIVLEGTGDMEVGDERFPIEPGDRVLIPPGTAQRVTNEGDRDLVFYCLCTPAWDPDCYVSLGEQ